jgi:D-alanine-D-alanine ligase
MEPRRISVLAYQEPDDPGPDVVVGQVSEALRSEGHAVDVVVLHDGIPELTRRIHDHRPDLLFNLMEGFGPGPLGAIAIVGVFDLLDIPYTGGGPGEFYLQEDKVLTKKLLAFDKVPYPSFVVFGRDADIEIAGAIKFPMIVKPLRGDASIGIDGSAIVHDARQLMERIARIHDSVGDCALVEEYVDGRELYVSILGNGSQAKAFPVVEMDFSAMPEGLPHIMDGKAKWDVDSPEYRGTKAVIAELGDETRARVQEVALAAYRALRVRDYGRIDLRLSSSGQPSVIEVNASCYLEKNSEFAMAAAAGGMAYPDLVNRIAELALERTRIQRRGPPREEPRLVARPA